MYLYVYVMYIHNMILYYYIYANTTYLIFGMRCSPIHHTTDCYVSNRIWNILNKINRFSKQYCFYCLLSPFVSRGSKVSVCVFLQTYISSIWNLLKLYCTLYYDVFWNGCWVEGIHICMYYMYNCITTIQFDWIFWRMMKLNI